MISEKLKFSVGNDIDASIYDGLNETICISHSTNHLGKGMNPTIFISALGKLVG